MNTTSRVTVDYQRDEHRVHLILYHLIWCPKRRKPILTGTIRKRCQQLLAQKCQAKGWEIVELAIQPNHVHIFVRVWPSDSAAEVVKELKGATSFNLRQEFKSVLSKLPSLWTRSYFAATVGSVSAEGIKAYIETQKGV
jgi:putative transposase